jgi:hypothetical protein
MRNKDPYWLEYKAAELSSLASPTPFTKDVTHRWHSMCYPVFTRLHGEYYDGTARRLREENLDALKDVAFAIWFGDCGKFHKDRIVLNTNVWGEKGSQLIVQYFGYLGYVSEVVDERGCYRVRLDVESSKSFYGLAEPQLPYWFVEKSASTQEKK